MKPANPAADSLIPQLEAIAAAGSDDSNAVRAAAVAMEALLLDRPSVETKHLADRLPGTTLDRLQRLYERYETDLEYEYAHKILRGEAVLEDYPLYGRFERLVSAEIELAEVRPGCRVLFIGSGPLPISPILFSRLAGTSVDCIDSSHGACDTSKAVLDRLGVGSHITVACAKGQSAEVGGHDSVAVALLAQPKDGICWNIKQRYPEGTPVILRFSAASRQPFYHGLDHAAEDRIRKYSFDPYTFGRIHHAGPGDTISSSVAYVRKSIEKI